MAQLRSLYWPSSAPAFTEPLGKAARTTWERSLVWSWRHYLRLWSKITQAPSTFRSRVSQEEIIQFTPPQTSVNGTHLESLATRAGPLFIPTSKPINFRVVFIEPPCPPRSGKG